MSRLQQYWSLNPCRMWWSCVDERTSRHSTEYRMKQIQQTDVCVFHYPHWKGCLPNHNVATSLLLFQLQLWALDISQYHHMTKNRCKSYEDSNQIIHCRNIWPQQSWLSLDQYKYLKFSTPQCRKGWICTFLDPNIIQCPDQLGVDLFESTSETALCPLLL